MGETREWDFELEFPGVTVTYSVLAVSEDAAHEEAQAWVPFILTGCPEGGPVLVGSREA